MTITHLQTSDVIYATFHLCEIVSRLSSLVTGAEISGFNVSLLVFAFKIEFYKGTEI